MIVLRLRGELRGAHVHIRVFVASDGMASAAAGQLVVRLEEWEALQRGEGVIKAVEYLKPPAVK